MTSPSLFVGVDVGKTSHYAVAVDATGATVRRTTVANDEAALGALVAWAKERAGALVVDQASGGAALLLALCWRAELPVAYLHGSAMARAREFYPGEGKTDPKDAFVLADVARAHPDRLVWVTPTPEARARLALLVGHDEDLRADANRLTNRLRGLLSSHWPGVERAFGDRLATPVALALLRRYPTGPKLAKAGAARASAVLRAAGGRQVEALAAAVCAAAAAQTAAVPGADTAGDLVRELADQLAGVLERREALEDEIARAFSGTPEAPILDSLPGVGARLGARILCEIGAITRFKTPAHLAAYAGLGPSPRRSGTSRTGAVAARRGNRRLKNALHLAAFASLGHPPSRAYYDRKRAEGKSHDAAIRCLARRRVDVLHAMLTSSRPYHYDGPADRPVAA
jgi:transposase